jgi:hypothetical protein
VDRHATGFVESLVIEACLADLEEMPVVAVEFLVDVDYVEIIVLHK